MISHDLPHSAVTSQIAFGQRDLHSTPELECMLDRHCRAVVCRLETLGNVGKLRPARGKINCPDDQFLEEFFDPPVGLQH